MEILELDLKHFGKFLEHRVKLQPGINIIYGDNETGKSTIHAFIRAMFFGLDRGRGKRDEYQLRQPWDNPAYFAGAMRLNYEGESYRIERNFYKNDRDVHLICETRGQELPADQQKLQELLDGMNETVFCNTIFIPQAGCETDEGLAEELRRFMVNFQETRDGALDVTRALNKLKGQKKELEAKKRREQELLDEKIARKQIETDYVKRELEQIEEEFPGQEPERIEEGFSGQEPEQIEEGFSGQEPEILREEQVSQGFYERFLFLLNLLLFLCGALGIACGIFASGTAGRVIFLAAGVLFLTLFGLTMRYTVRSGELERAGQEERQTRFLERQQAERQTRFLERQLAEGRRIWKHEEERKNRKEKSARLHILDQETRDLFREREQLASYDREIEGVDLAMLRIRELSARIYREAGTDFGRAASEILEEITQGRYTQIALDEKMEVRINTPSRLLYLNQVSHGTMDQIYFALRMAAGQLLSNGAPLPVILDETFAMYDEERLEAALRWLDRSGRQVILFTCQKREKEILDRIRRKN